MKAYNSKFILVLLMLPVLFLSSCIKDKCERTRSYTWFEPVYKTTAEVRANIKSNAPKEIKAPGKFFVLGNYIYLNDINRGIHIIDNSNPANPVNKAFIDIPGNVDIAVKGNILYADLYTDLVALDISNPLQAVKTKIIDNVFPERFYTGFRADSSKMIYDWVRHDTTVVEDCNVGSSWMFKRTDVVFFSGTAAGGVGPVSVGGVVPVGISGSLSRFALVNNYLYTLANYNKIKVVDITNMPNPIAVNEVAISNWGLETLYPFQDKLFVGSQTGMHIFSLQNPVSPVETGTFSHARVCDPVIADANYAYVTLRNGSRCTGFLNELDIVNISNIYSPVLVKKYDLTNPRGLSKDGNLLFICDGADGLKIFDASNVQSINLLRRIEMPETFDVITYNGLAMVVAKDGIYQYDYSNINNVQLLSKMTIAP